MYCWNCGEKNPEGAKFCSKCGSALTGDEKENKSFVEAEEQLAAEPKISSNRFKGSNKKIIYGGVGLVALILIVILGKTIFFADKSNPLESLYDSSKQTLLSKGFEVNGSLAYQNYRTDSDGDQIASEDQTEFEGSLALGSDLKDSLFQTSILADGDQLKMYYADNQLGYQESGGYEYVEDNFVSVLNELLENLTGDDLNSNDLVKDQQLNFSAHVNNLNDGIDNLNIALKDSGYDITIPEVEVIQTILEDFIYNGCDDTEVTDRFLTEVNQAGDQTSFTINLPDFVKAFSKYVDDLQDQKNHLADLSISQRKAADFSESLNFATVAINQFYNENEDTFETIALSFTTEGNYLKNLNVEVASFYNWEMTLSNVDNPSLNSKTLKGKINALED